MSDKRQALEAFLAQIGAEPVDPAIMDRAFAEGPGEASGAPEVAGLPMPDVLRVEMLESLVVALLADRVGLKVEDYLGPDAAADPQVQEMAAALDHALKQFIAELTYVAMPGFPHDKMWMTKVIPHISARMQKRLAELRGEKAA
jgi:hypothetical protein